MFILKDNTLPSTLDLTHQTGTDVSYSKVEEYDKTFELLEDEEKADSFEGVIEGYHSLFYRLKDDPQNLYVEIAIESPEGQRSYALYKAEFMTDNYYFHFKEKS